jgi:hypothetical protein
MRTAYAQANLGGGTGTSAPRTGALTEGVSGHSDRADCTKRGVAPSRISIIFSEPAEGMAGGRCPHVSRALLSARQIAHGRRGSNASLAATTIDSVLA